MSSEKQTFASCKAKNFEIQKQKNYTIIQEALLTLYKHVETSSILRELKAFIAQES
jgi:hypothetical protein